MLQTDSTGAVIIDYPNEALCSIWHSVTAVIWPKQDWLFDLVDGVGSSEQFCAIDTGYTVTLQTPYGWIQVQGATVGIAVDPTGMTVTLYEGSAVLTCACGQTQTVAPGKSYFVDAVTFGIRRVTHAPLTSEEQFRISQIGGDVAFSLQPSQSTPGAAAILSPLPCASESSLRSINDDVATSVTFQNQSDIALSIFWLDFSGQRVPYRTLAAGAAYTQSTFLTHPWLIADSTGACIAIIQPTAGPSIAVIAR